ncbi:hypothetical protein Droror1_Dr00001947 [Drosera rotundifolia]
MIVTASFGVSDGKQLSSQLEMDSLHGEDDHSSGETHLRDVLSLESPDTSYILEEPLVSPRIGEEYQAEIPQLLTESERLQLLSNPAEAPTTIDVSHSFLMGLPVPITWIKEVKTTSDEQVGVSDDQTDDAAHSNEQVNLINDTKKHQNFKGDASNQLYETSGCFPIPGLLTGSWSEFEIDCFVHGLYIFGKNLLQVGRFMDSKDMGQILSFYYGKFYRSPSYCRWSDCRKMSSRKSVVGQKLFSGGRQQELFSRLLPRLSEESKTTLLEASKAYAEGKTSLEEYVSSLKSMVGLHALVDAVGIGKGKDDLTTLAIETSRTARTSTSRPELPSGKDFTSLSCSEIVEFLTGGSRLSKARSNDLFWEAIWPRLLAKGWQSEGYKGSKSGLVFLMPGVKKFSRRKLVKGDQYFDSVSDVLGRVMSEPQLLELDDGEAAGNASKVESGRANGATSSSDDDNASGHKRHRYLKPRVSSTANLMMFTVVDTSAGDTENPSKIRELRSLPLQPKRPVGVKKQSAEINESLLTKSAEEPVTSDAPLSDMNANCVNASHSADLAKEELEASKIASDSPKPSDGLPESLTCQESSLSQGQPSRTIKHQFSRRPKVDRPSSLFPVLKKRKVLDCSIACAMSSAGEEPEVILSSCAQESTVASIADNVTETELSSIAADNSVEKNQQSAVINTSEEHDDKPAVLDSDNLNEPYPVKVEPETEMQIKVEAEGNDGSESHPVSSEPVAATEQEPAVSGRRQSTRTRPPTTKIREALELGLLSPKQTRKRQRAWSTEDEKPRLSTRLRHVRKTLSTNSSADEGTTNSMVNGCDKVSDSMAHILSHKSSRPIILKVRSSVPTNCAVGEGTEPDGSDHGMERAFNHRKIPDGNHTRKTGSVNSIRPCGQEQVSNSGSGNSFIDGSTERRENGDSGVCNSMARTVDQKPKLSYRFIVRNTEAAKCNVGENAESRGSGNVMVSANLAQNVDKKSWPYVMPHVSNSDSEKCRLGEDERANDSGRSGQLHALKMKSTDCNAGKVTESEANRHKRVPSIIRKKSKHKLSGRSNIRRTDSANHSVGEGTESRTVFNSMMQALSNPLIHANQQVARELLEFVRPSKHSKTQSDVSIMLNAHDNIPPVEVNNSTFGDMTSPSRSRTAMEG